MDCHLALGVQTTIIVLALILLLVRFWIRLSWSRQRLLLSDYFVFMGWMAALGNYICHTLLFQKDAAQLVNGTPSIPQLKLNYAATFFLEVGLYFPKASILAFYWDLIPLCYNRMRIALSIIIAYTTMAAAITILLDIFWCHSIPDNWSTRPGDCAVWDSWETFGTSWALNITTDLAVFLLPFFLLRYLTIPRRQKWGVAAIFGIGSLTLIVSIGRFTWFTLNSDIAAGDTWCTAEIGTATIAVCLPALKPLLKSKGLTLNDTVYPISNAAEVRTDSTKHEDLCVVLKRVDSGENVEGMRAFPGITQEYSLW